MSATAPYSEEAKAIKECYTTFIHPDFQTIEDYVFNFKAICETEY
jgi:hypothetical protein